MMTLPEVIETPPWKRLALLEQDIIRSVPPIDPPACHWLRSDAGPSYCRKHAWEARWKELPSFGPCPEEPDWLWRSKLEDLMAEGIDGCEDMGNESDHPERCDVCGCTLEYLLSEEGQDQEILHFKENPIQPSQPITGEHTYALTRIFMNLDQPSADPERVAAALTLAEDTLSAINVQKGGSQVASSAST